MMGGEGKVAERGFERGSLMGVWARREPLVLNVAMGT